MAGKVILSLLFALVPLVAYAGNCGQFFVQQHHVAPVVLAQPVLAYQPLYYQAGRDIEAQAFAEKVARLAAPLIAQQLRTSELKQDVKAEARAGVMATKCGSCHSGAAPKGGLVLDGSAPVPDAAFRRIMEMAGLNKDVPPAMQKAIASLTAEDKGRLMEEMLSLKSAE